MSTESPLPAAWTFRPGSQNPDVYPESADLTLSAADTGLYRLTWSDAGGSGRSLDGLARIHIGGVHRLRSGDARGSDQLSYQVEIEVSGTGGVMALTGEVKGGGGNGGDPGDLSGSWGADAKP